MMSLIANSKKRKSGLLTLHLRNFSLIRTDIVEHIGSYCRKFYKQENDKKKLYQNMKNHCTRPWKMLGDFKF